MAMKYFAILTNQGAAKLANATALGTQLNLTHMAAGDGNGSLPTPDPAQTKLVNQKRIALLNMLSVDPNDANQIIAEQIIPENEGGFWIREIGLYDADGVLIAVANCPETYKPLLLEGSARTQTLRMALVVSSTSAVTLKIDPSVVLATRKYADELLSNHLEAANPHSQYLQIAQALKEIADAGSDAVAAALNHLGLGEGSALPVGVPVPWPTATPPVGWLQCNGAAFTAAQYPKLALAYPKLVLPDLRGQFIRGWGGVEMDPGRALLSSQSATIVGMGDPTKTSTALVTLVNNTDDNANTMRELLGGESVENLPGIGYSTGTGASMMANGAYVSMKVRPANIAFNYIVRAA
ncbi:phage tail protein [Kosakonia sp. H02]|nr:phage tail protein [Kosakonia sp. H02]